MDFVATLDDLRDAVRLVMPAVAEKELVQAWTHLHFYPGRVQAGNGLCTIDAPCNHTFTEEVNVPAKRLSNALLAYPEGEECSVFYDAARQRVKLHGKQLRTTLPTLAGAAFPRVAIQEHAWSFTLAVELLMRLRKVLPYAAQDATRPWAQGVRLSATLRATNNTTLVEIPLAFTCDPVTLPLALVEVIDAIGVEPEGVHVNHDADMYVVLKYPGDVYLRSRVVSGEWPLVVEELLARCDTLRNVSEAVPGDLLRVVTDVARFAEDTTVPELLFTPEGVRTPDGTTYAVHGGFTCWHTPSPRVRLEVVQGVLECASRWDLTKYPAPIPFDNDEGLRGVFIGLSPWTPKKEEPQ